MIYHEILVCSVLNNECNVYVINCIVMYKKFDI